MFKKMMMVVVIFIQVLLMIGYSFLEIPMSNVSCLMLWCVCAAVIYLIGKSTQMV